MSNSKHEGYREYTESEATVTIQLSGGTVKGKVIVHACPGIACLGAIDYLVSKHGYRWDKSRARR